MRMYTWDNPHGPGCEAEFIVEAGAWSPCRCGEDVFEALLQAHKDKRAAEHGGRTLRLGGADMGAEALEQALDLSVYLMGMLLESRDEQERYRQEARDSAQMAGKALRELGEAQAALESLTRTVRIKDSDLSMVIAKNKDWEEISAKDESIKARLVEDARRFRIQVREVTADLEKAYADIARLEKERTALEGCHCGGCCQLPCQIHRRV